MSKYIIIFISFFFAVGCVPTAKNQWVSTIKVKPHEVPVSEAFLERVRANWYYNTKTKCYGANKWFRVEWRRTDPKIDKLNRQQFIAIFGQPDSICQGWVEKKEYERFLYAHKDLEMMSNLGYLCSAPYSSSPYLYEGYLHEEGVFFYEIPEDHKLYNKKFDFKKLDSLYISATAGYKPMLVDSTILVDSIRGIKKTFKFVSNNHELQAIRDKKAKSIIRDYFFYNKKAKHYIWISGFPLPSSCDSKAEVKRLFGKPTKVETNGDLIYHISLPGRYGRPSYIRWSPLPNGKYSVTVNIER